MIKEYNKLPLQVMETKNRNISIFSTDGKNIDADVVKTFGEEWLKFKDYSDEEIRLFALQYFDILDESIINKSTYALDIGCGTGRWTKYLAGRIGFIEAIDPSNAVVAADYLLKNVENVRITRASVETIPFDDETFDFAMSIGVLHHIPDTQKAMIDCVKKVKKGGYFYCYLYYNLDSKGFFYKSIFWLSNLVRLLVSKMPAGLKRFSCDVLAIFLYMPFVMTSRLLSRSGFKSLAKRIPLSDYANKTFFIIRNDSLDRFGTKLEHRFSKAEVITMMEKSGLENIIVSPSSPYYHAVGRKK
jgi:ubiquinone/menaquinone biosynthesis C-methylase UbiE